VPRTAAPAKPAATGKTSVGKMLTNPARADEALAVPDAGWTLKVDDTHGVHAQLFAANGQAGQSAPLLDLALTSGDIMHDLTGAQTVDVGGTTYAVRTELQGDHYAFAVARDIGGGTFSVIAAGHADAALVAGTSHAIGFDAIQSFLASSSGSLG